VDRQNVVIYQSVQGGCEGAFGERTNVACNLAVSLRTQGSKMKIAVSVAATCGCNPPLKQCNFTLRNIEQYCNG
jgi:hypothetical protein